MDVRAGVKDYFARLTPEQRAAHGGLNPTPDTLQKRWVGARAAKKEAYAAAEPWAVRAEARAAEERERAEARAAERRTRAEALALAAATVPLTEEETAALRAGGYVGERARRAVAARTVDVVLAGEGPAGAAAALRRQSNRKSADESKKRAKKCAEAVAQEEAQLVERVTGLLVDLGRGGSNILDDDGDDGDEFGGHLDTEADEKELKALVKAKADPLVIKRKRNAIAQKRTAARKKASLDKARGRVALLKIRVEALEEELRAQVAA